MAITLSRDLAQWVAANDDIRSRMGPFSNATPYRNYNMDHEDVMVGRWFFDFRVPHTIIKDCRFHDVHTGENIRPISARSLGIHHIRLNELGGLFQRFHDTFNSATAWPNGAVAKGKRSPRGSDLRVIC